MHSLHSGRQGIAILVQEARFNCRTKRHVILFGYLHRPCKAKDPYQDSVRFMPNDKQPEHGNESESIECCWERNFTGMHFWARG